MRSIQRKVQPRGWMLGGMVTENIEHVLKKRARLIQGKSSHKEGGCGWNGCEK